MYDLYFVCKKARDLRHDLFLRKLKTIWKRNLRQNCIELRQNIFRFLCFTKWNHLIKHHWYQKCQTIGFISESDISSYTGLRGSVRSISRCYYRDMSHLTNFFFWSKFFFDIKNYKKINFVQYIHHLPSPRPLTSCEHFCCMHVLSQDQCHSILW